MAAFLLLRPKGGKSHESHVCGTDVISAAQVTDESLCATSRNHVRGARKLRVGRAKPHKAAIRVKIDSAPFVTGFPPHAFVVKKQR